MRLYAYIESSATLQHRLAYRRVSYPTYAGVEQVIPARNLCILYGRSVRLAQTLILLDYDFQAGRITGDMENRRTAHGPHHGGRQTPPLLAAVIQYEYHLVCG